MMELENLHLASVIIVVVIGQEISTDAKIYGWKWNK